MNILLWVLQALAVVIHGTSGVMKIFLFDKVSADVPSFGALPRPAWIVLGILELVCTAGLIVPAAFQWRPVSGSLPGSSDNGQMKPKLYESLAEWWPLMSAPGEYEEAAAVYGERLAESGDAPAKTVLELGSGGGNNAFFLKRRFEMTLVDPSSGMLAHSRRLNPECEHHEGDMRTFRMGAGGQFDRVFVQDAIFYMLDLQDLGQAMETAFFHCRPGGALLIAPDYVAETFQPGTEEGGHDGADRSMRYLAWRWDPDPSDHTYLLDIAFLLRDPSGSVRVEHDRHIGGLFPRAEWLRLLREAGFVPANLTYHHSDVGYPLDLFVGVKPLRISG